MATDVIMPQMGESIFEGTITKWLKQVGDAVAKDEPLFEISTDKVDAEIPAPVGGTLTEIKANEGETVQINTVVAVIGAASEAKASAAPDTKAPQAVEAPALSAAKPATAPSILTAAGTDVVMPQMGESIFEGTITKWLKKIGETVNKDEPLFEISTDKVDAEIPAPVGGTLTEIKAVEGETVAVNTVVAVIGGAGTVSATPAVVDAESAMTAASEPAISSDSEDTKKSATAPPRSSPLVRRIAREHQLDLTQISGTGAGGRITKQDALGYLAGNGIGTKSASPSAVAVAAAASLPGQLVPLSRMRSIIAQRMVESTRISPQVHTVFKVDMTRIARLREKEKTKYEQRNGVRLTYMPFIASAVIQTLRKFPIVNASLESTPSGDAIRYHRNINLGIAVALDWGLIVPVIHQAEERSFLGLARAVVDLAERARTKRLKPDEVQGSTFTLTNSGIFGEEFGTPIINQPDSAILAIGALKKEAVVLTDAEGNDTIAIRSMQHFCLGFDHRTIDGADGGRFMAEFKKTLENWSDEIG